MSKTTSETRYHVCCSFGSELNRSCVIISPCLHVQTRIRLDHRSAPIHRIFSVQPQDVQTQEQLLHLGFKTSEYCYSLADTRAAIKNKVHTPFLLASRLGTSKGVPRNLLIIRCHGYGLSLKTRRVAIEDHKHGRHVQRFKGCGRWPTEI